MAEMQLQLEEVGSICSEWAHLEKLIAITIWWLLNLSREDGGIVTDNLDMKPRAEMLAKLAKRKNHILSADEQQLIADTVSQIAELTPKRNLAVHGVRSLDEAIGATYATIGRGKYKDQPQEVTYESLKTITDRLVSISIPFAEFLCRRGVIKI